MKTNTNFTDAIKRKFITLPGEQLILAERKHWLVFAVPITILILMGLAAIGTIISAGVISNKYLVLLAPSILLVIVFVSSLSLRSLVDWYFNIYILTNRKIMEISYSPLTSHQINEVMLDQVKCTEIDTKIEGIVNDFLDIGHVMITFDRPTHQDAFVMDYVSDPREIKNYVQNIVNRRSPPILPVSNSTGGDGWFTKSKTIPNRWIYTEEIINPIEKGEVWTIS